MAIPPPYNLRWDPDYPCVGSKDSGTAFLGDITIGSYVRLNDGTGWIYRVDGIRTKWVSKGYGKVATKASAKRAVERAWKTWLQFAGLVE
jgi:hypothetical protein